MSAWRTDAPPKDKVFLAEVKGVPWPTLCVWNGANEQFAYASPQCGPYMGKWNDWNFETEYDPEKYILAWMPLPKLPEGHK